MIRAGVPCGAAQRAAGGLGPETTGSPTAEEPETCGYNLLHIYLNTQQYINSDIYIYIDTLTYMYVRTHVYIHAYTIFACIHTDVHKVILKLRV